MINPFFFSQNTPQLGEYPQSMFWAKEDNNMHPCKHKFYYIKVGSICNTRRCYFDDLLTGLTQQSDLAQVYWFPGITDVSRKRLCFPILYHSFMIPGAMVISVA